MSTSMKGTAPTPESPKKLVSLQLKQTGPADVELELHVEDQIPALQRIKLVSLLQKSLGEAVIKFANEAEIEDPDDYLDDDHV